MEISSAVSFPGLTIGIIFAHFHILGKQVVLKHPLYRAVIDLGNKMKTCRRMSLVILSSPGMSFFFIPFMVSPISTGVNSLSSSVFIGSLISALISLWRSFSVPSSSSGVKESI